jgi:hypothetical protein
MNEARSIPRGSFFVAIGGFDIASLSTSSGHQQDLPDATLFYRRLSLGRLTEWQFLADRDCQLAIPHRFGHELKRSSVEMREDRRQLYRRVLRGILRCSDN